MHKHVEITRLEDLDTDPEESGPIVVDVECFECFIQGIIAGTIVVEE